MVTASHTREVGHEELVSPAIPALPFEGDLVPARDAAPGGFASRRA